MPADTTPPVVTITAPSGTLASGTSNTSLAVTTNETASCSYATSAGTAFVSMTPFTTTGGMSHASTISGLSDGSSYTYYVKCKDTAGNISADSLVAFSVASPSSPMPPSPGPTSSGPVVYWSLDAATMNWTNNTAQDMSGNGNTGVLSGLTSTAQVVGKFGEALQFDGTDGPLSSTNAILSNTVPNGFSVVMWVKTTTVNSQIFEMGGSNALTFFTGGGKSGYCGIRDVSNGFTYTPSATPITDGLWHYIGCVLDRTTNTLTLYLDGVSTASISASKFNSFAGAGADLYVGNRVYKSQGINGSVDDVRVYNRALSAQEVQALYAGTLSMNTNASQVAAAAQASELDLLRQELLKILKLLNAL